NRVVVGRGRLGLLRGSGAGVEQGQRKRRTERPETVGQGRQLGQTGTLIAARPADAQVGKKRGFGHADLGIGRGHGALGGGNIRAAFQQLGRQRKRNFRQR